MNQRLPKGFEISRVDRSQEKVVANLLELYCHDMSQWFQIDANEFGLYDYDPEKVWTPHIDVFVAYAGEIPIGFALVDSASSYTNDADTKDMEEFFVVRRHRHSGIADALAVHVWRLYPGAWLIRVMQGNLPALPFWRRMVADYTKGAYTEEVREVSGRTWSYFAFA